jgi:hypothetical protein
MEAKGLVDQLMHRVIGMRLEINKVLEHSFFQTMESDQKSASSSSGSNSNKRTLEGATDHEHDAKKSRHGNDIENGGDSEEVFESVHISFSERLIGQGHSLQDIRGGPFVNGNHPVSM